MQQLIFAGLNFRQALEEFDIKIKKLHPYQRYIIIHTAVMNSH